VLDDLIRRGLRRPELLIVDGAPGLEAAIAAVWDGVPVQRCTVGSLKKWPPHRLYAAIGPATALTSKPAPRRDLRNASGLQDTIQRRRSARSAAASRLRLMAAAVR
jgi:Transposase, Mutator family